MKAHQTSIPCPYCGKGINEDSAGCPGIKIGYHLNEATRPHVEVILRGQFSVVRSQSDDGRVEHRMVLRGIKPDHRKMILVEEGEVEFLAANRLVFRVHYNEEGKPKAESV